MRRPVHGATIRPGPCRPASGYGRALGRPGPERAGATASELRPDALDPSVFFEPVRTAELEADAPATP
jgi:hypothetical protein